MIVVLFVKDDLFDIHSRYIHQAKSRLLLTAKSASFMKIIRDTLNLTLKFRSLLVASDFKYSALLESQITALNSKFHEYTKFLHLGNLIFTPIISLSHLNVYFSVGKSQRSESRDPFERTAGSIKFQRLLQ